MRREALAKMGVELVMRTRVVGVDALGVDIEGPDGKDRIAAGTTMGRRGSRRRLWLECLPRRPEATLTGQAGSPCFPT